MKHRLPLSILDRRDFVLGLGVAAIAAGCLPAPLVAQEKPVTWEEALKSLIGDAKPVDGKIALELPEIAENGNTVPFSVSVDSAMTPSDHVKAVHVLSTGNPQPAVASFRFTPDSGKAGASSRMRLAKTQDVVAVAELSDGRVIMSKRLVKVTIGGCGG